jgi:hypothetical protein
MAFLDFPTLSADATILYPQDDYLDPDVVSQFEDQQSVEVQSTGSGGYWSKLSVIIEAPETEADGIFDFLKGQRLRGIPFYFTHRKRGRILVRYWPDTNPPTLPYVRVVAGQPDRVQFQLPLREESIGSSGGGGVVFGG